MNAAADRGAPEQHGAAVTAGRAAGGRGPKPQQPPVRVARHPPGSGRVLSFLRSVAARETSCEGGLGRAEKEHRCPGGNGPMGHRAKQLGQWAHNERASVGTEAGGAAWPGTVACSQRRQCVEGQWSETAKVSLQLLQWRTEGQTVCAPVYGWAAVGGTSRPVIGRGGSTGDPEARSSGRFSRRSAREPGGARTEAGCGGVGSLSGTSAVWPQTACRIQLPFSDLAS